MIWPPREGQIHCWNTVKSLAQNYKPICWFHRHWDASIPFSISCFSDDWSSRCEKYSLGLPEYERQLKCSSLVYGYSSLKYQPCTKDQTVSESPYLLNLVLGPPDYLPSRFDFATNCGLQCSDVCSINNTHFWFITRLLASQNKYRYSTPPDMIRYSNCTRSISWSTSFLLRSTPTSFRELARLNRPCSTDRQTWITLLCSWHIAITHAFAFRPAAGRSESINASQSWFSWLCH